MRLMQFQIDDIIKTALLEDINYIDVTTDYLVDENSVSTAKYVSKDEGILCGIDVAMRVFQLLDSNVKCEIFIHDGEKVKKGDIIAKTYQRLRILLNQLIINIRQNTRCSGCCPHAKNSFYIRLRKCPINILCSFFICAGHIAAHFIKMRSKNSFKTQRLQKIQAVFNFSNAPDLRRWRN